MDVARYLQLNANDTQDLILDLLCKARHWSLSNEDYLLKDLALLVCSITRLGTKCFNVSRRSLKLYIKEQKFVIPKN